MLGKRDQALVVALVLVGVLGLPDGSRAEFACSGHGRAYLAGFPADAGSPFYAALEGDDVGVTITVTQGDCGGERAQATFATEDGTAVAPSDYGAVTPQDTVPLCRDSHPEYCVGADPEHQVDVSTEVAEGDAERAVKSFWFQLTSGTYGLADPSSAPIHIIDVDGAPRASLEPTVDGSGAVAYARSESFARILIPVFLAGTSDGGSVGFTVEPAQAFPATPGQDYTVVTPSPLAIGQDRVGFIEIGIVNDKEAEAPESVVIALTGTVDGPASTTFTILDNEEKMPPKSRFHHPRNKWKYNKADYRIREFHIFATDEEGGSGVVAAEMALRRNLANGKCAWKVKKGWEKKSCQNRTWLPTKYEDVGELFYYRMNQLKPSVGTKIKSYTAFSRAIDGAGNVEKEFNKKRNMNTFEIRRKGKTRKA